MVCFNEHTFTSCFATHILLTTSTSTWMSQCALKFRFRSISQPPYYLKINDTYITPVWFIECVCVCTGTLRRLLFRLRWAANCCTGTSACMSGCPLLAALLAGCTRLPLPRLAALPWPGICVLFVLLRCKCILKEAWAIESRV